MGRIPPGLTEMVRKLSVSIALSSFSVRPLMRENSARPFSLWSAPSPDTKTKRNGLELVPSEEKARANVSV
jgi:hypothetical protein